VFLASPSDVTEERDRARKVIEELPHRPAFVGRVTLRAVSWDDARAPVPMRAADPPQASLMKDLPPPSACDLTFVILWSRMGTALSPDFARDSGRAYASGTEWEYWNAREAKPEDVYVYRRTAPPPTGAAAHADEARRQLEALELFLHNFRNADGSYSGGLNTYADEADFELQFRLHLERLVSRKLDQTHAARTATARAETEEVKRTAARTRYKALFGVLAVGALVAIAAWMTRPKPQVSLTGVQALLRDDERSPLMLEARYRASMVASDQEAFLQLDDEESFSAPLYQIKLAEKEQVQAIFVPAGSLNGLRRGVERWQGWARIVVLEGGEETNATSAVLPIKAELEK
jgi:hypothetical protein